MELKRARQATLRNTQVDTLPQERESEKKESMKIQCKKHFIDAEYYSKELNEYVCNQCLVEQGGLHAISDSTKKNMMEFDTIRQMTMEYIKKNRQNVNTMLNWKDSIRQTLMKVKLEFMKELDQYTDKFVQSLRQIDGSNELATFVGEDKRQALQLLDMEKKFQTIEEVYTDINKTLPEKKLEKIQNVQPQMERIKIEVQELGIHMQTQNKALKSALVRTVNTDGLRQKITEKFMGYLHANVNRSESASTKPKPQHTDSFLISKKEDDQPQDQSAKQMPNTENKLSAKRQTVSITLKNLNESQRSKDVVQSSNSQIDNYKINNQNSVYYLKPNSDEAHFLDLKKRSFVKETLFWPPKNTNGVLPDKFTSVQSQSGQIFVVGGLVNNNPSSGMLKIEQNFNVSELPPMDTPRFNLPVAFVQDRFICAIGGLSVQNNPSKTCQVFDTVKSIWFEMKPIESPRYSTTAIVMNNEGIYIMPGCASSESNNAVAGMGSLKILVLDLKKANQFDKNDKEYVKALSQQNWTSLIVTQPQFNIQQPTVGIAISEKEMIIFGGTKDSVYTFDTSDIKETNTAVIKLHDISQLRQVASFCKDGEIFGRVFQNQYIYVTDTSKMNLHCCVLNNESTWDLQPLNQLGIN